MRNEYFKDITAVVKLLMKIQNDLNFQEFIKYIPYKRFIIMMIIPRRVRYEGNVALRVDQRIILV